MCKKNVKSLEKVYKTEEFFIGKKWKICTKRVQKGTKSLQKGRKQVQKVGKKSTNSGQEVDKKGQKVYKRCKRSVLLNSCQSCVLQRCLTNQDWFSSAGW